MSRKLIALLLFTGFDGSYARVKSRPGSLLQNFFSGPDNEKPLLLGILAPETLG